MAIDIYYFSGTGNSLAVARVLAEKMNANLIPVSDVIDQDCIVTIAETIGIVFPLYDFKPPKIIEVFIGKLDDIQSKYLFSVCTYGITPSKASIYIDNLIRKYGGKLSGGFAIQMPHNGIGSSKFSEKDRERQFESCSAKLENISEYVVKQRTGKLESSSILVSIILSGLFLRMVPTFYKLLKQVLFKGWKSLALNVNDRCAGCGSCASICPLKNIKIVDTKPSWGDHCAGCLACFHWCPNDAIQVGKSDLNISKYHHPDVKIGDMMNKNANNY